MPAVFVHGNPETSEVWDGLRSDTVAVSMPGFSCSRPDDFGSSKEEYVRHTPEAYLRAMVAGEAPDARRDP